MAAPLLFCVFVVWSLVRQDPAREAASRAPQRESVRQQDPPLQPADLEALLARALRGAMTPEETNSILREIADRRLTVAGTDLLQLAQTTLALADKGLARRRCLDSSSQDESRYLRPLQEYVARGITPAEELLEKFHGPWEGSVEPVFKEYAY